MANPSPYESFPVPPEAPYVYDDPRLLYDEPCFFYDGGFDLICLYGDVALRRRVGGGTSAATTAATTKSYPQPEMIDLLFRSYLEFVNDEEYNEKHKIKKYSFKKKSEINVKTTNLAVKKSKYVLTSEYFSPKVIDRNLEVGDMSIKEAKTTFSSSKPELKLKSYVSSSLKLNKARKIKFSTAIFKKK